MMDRRMRAALAAWGGVIALAATVGLHAQAPRPAGEVTGAPQAAVTGESAEPTREALYEVVDGYPPTLGQVLRLDPTLMTNRDYLAGYPRLAAFLAVHPEVPRNPAFYLERYDAALPGDARVESTRLSRAVVEFVGTLIVLSVMLVVVFGVLRHVLDYRRWVRTSRLQADLHEKILDRIGSNETLLTYLDSPAGRRLLAPAAGGRDSAAPYGRILLSVQVGVLLLALAAGVSLVRGRVAEELTGLLTGVSVVGFSLGVGFLVAAAASYALSRRFGLLSEAPPGRVESA